VKFVPNVTLTAAGTPQVIAATDSLGAYSLSGLSGSNYTVTPTKTGDVNGIDSLDAARIQQHLVGLITLTPNQLIAADTDGNGVVNSLDAARIQQYLVQIPAQNIIGEWKFAPADKQYNPVSGNLSGEDYQAILVGDVSGNWAPPQSPPQNFSVSEEISADENTNGDTGQTKTSVESTESADGETAAETAAMGATVSVSLPTNATAAAGSTVTIPVSIGALPANTSIQSFDFSVFFDPAVLQPTTPAGSNTGTLSANCSVFANSPSSGKVIVSGACGQQPIISGSGTLFNLTFTVVGTDNQQTVLSFTDPISNTTQFEFNNGTPAAATNNGQFTVLGTTAASVSVSGRAVTAQGRGIRNVQITMIDSQGNERTTQTTSFGYYRFDNVMAGETITLTAKARRFRFNQSTIVRTTNESVTDADFVSEQR
jgi:hypothetical protein